RHNDFVAGLNISQNRRHFQCRRAGMCQEHLAATEVFLQPCLAFFCEGSVTGGMVVLNNGLGNVKKFFAGNKGLIEGNFIFIVRHVSSLLSSVLNSSLLLERYYCSYKN